MTLYEIVKARLETGLLDAAREEGIGIAHRRYHQLVQLAYTAQLVDGDMMTEYLREGRGN